MKNYITIAGGTTHKLDLDGIVGNNNEVRLICETEGGAISIILPKISSLGNTISQKIYIDDASDQASVNPITIIASEGDTVENAESVVMDTDGEKKQVYISSKAEWGMIGDGGTGVGQTLFAPNTGDIRMNDNYDNEIIAAGVETVYGGITLYADNLTLISFPDLVTITGKFIVSQPASIDVILNFPKLKEVNKIAVQGNPSLTDISLPSLEVTKIYENQEGEAYVDIQDNPELLSVDLSNYILSEEEGINISNNEKLTTIIINKDLVCASSEYNFNSNALSQASVDDILNKLDLGGLSNQVLKLEGGTNSTPSAAGLISKGNLQAKGWTVTNN